MNIDFLKLIYKLSGYDLAKASDRLQKIQNMPNDLFISWKNRKKWEIARFHFDNNQFYKNKVGKYFPDKWEDLPIMKKSDYQIKIEGLLSKNYKKNKVYISNTSGSSGKPLFFAKNKSAHSMDVALFEDRYNWHGLYLNSYQARFYGIPLEIIPYTKERLKDKILNRLRFSVFDLSEKVLEKYFKKFINGRFEYIYGYTNSLVIFAKFLLKNNYLLKNYCTTLKCCISTSEMLTNENRKILNSAFGIPVINEYGASEVGLIAFEDIKSNWLLSEETLFYEVKKMESINDSNNSGNLILTDLDNKAMPFIRYNIGDIGSINDDLLINEKYRIIENFLGRENDLILLPSGKVVPGFTIYYLSKSLLESLGIIKEYLIIQKKLDEFIFEVVTETPINKFQEKEIILKIEKYLEPNINISINSVDKINRGNSSKFKHFISEL